MFCLNLLTIPLLSIKAKSAKPSASHFENPTPAASALEMAREHLQHGHPSERMWRTLPLTPSRNSGFVDLELVDQEHFCS